MLVTSNVIDRTPRKSLHGPMKLILTLVKIDHLALRNDGISHYNLLLDTAQQPVDKKKQLMINCAILTTERAVS